MKTKEELNALKKEVETVSRKLHELTDEDLEQITGGGVLVKTYTDENGQECSHTSALRQRGVAVD